MDFGNSYELQGGMRIIAKGWGTGQAGGRGVYGAQKYREDAAFKKNISDALAHSTFRLLHPVLFVQKQNATTDAIAREKK